MLKYLRIAWSASWSVMAALLSVLAFRETDHIHGLPIYSPKWIYVFLAALIAYGPWLRFSLRTLLIVTTLVAVGLRIIVVSR